MLLGAIILTIVGGIWLFAKNPSAPAGPRPTAVVRTTTPTPVPTTAPTPTPNPATALSGAIAVGTRVEIVGTGEVGLSIRAEAHTNGERLDVATEGEMLLIVAGPEEADGYTWWFLRDESNAAREGWAVEDYLSPIE
jgi:hypothetical protein